MKKVLVVDDDHHLTEVLSDALEAQAFQVKRAHSAVEGLRQALAFKPDAIILDVIMETDTAGFEFIYQLRDRREDSRYRELRGTPIIVYSGINQETNFRFSLNEDASFLPAISAMLTKPAPLDVLLGKVKEAVSSVEV